MKKIPLSIQNTIISSFSTIEELISEIGTIFNNEDRIFVKIKKSPNKEIEKKLEEIKEILKKVKEELNLKEEVISDKAIIGSRCAKIWEILNDMKVEKLKKYGNIPEDLKNYLNPLIEKILKLVNEIVDL